MKSLQEPESQTQEVCFELINRFSVDRKTMMLSCGVMCLTSQISILRRKGLHIKTIETQTLNKYGRQVKFSKYKLLNKKEAVQVYNQMKLNQAKKTINES